MAFVRRAAHSAVTPNTQANNGMKHATDRSAQSGVRVVVLLQARETGIGPVLFRCNQATYGHYAVNRGPDLAPFAAIVFGNSAIRRSDSSPVLAVTR